MLSFESIKQAWDEVAKTRASQFAARVRTLSDLRRVTCGLVSRDAASVTVQFDHIDEAVDKVDDVARLKATILDWIKSFAKVRLSRASQTSLVVGIELKPEFERQIKPAQNPAPAPQRRGPMTSVVGRRTVQPGVTNVPS